MDSRFCLIACSLWESSCLQAGFSSSGSSSGSPSE